MAKSYRMPESFCPTCGHRLDGATDTVSGARKPMPGDFSACFYCGEMLRFNAELKLVLMEKDDPDLTPELRATLEAAQRWVRTRAAQN